MQRRLEQYWKHYYSDPEVHGRAWLDLSNSRVQLQSMSLCLEAAGDVLGSACADLGCGRGQLARALRALGAGAVLGVDLVEAVVAENRSKCPEIEWMPGDLMQREFMELLPNFDRIFLVEVLQYVDMASAVRVAWRRLRPGGRLICMVPNHACPIVARAIERFGECYRAIAPATVASIAESLPGLAMWAGRGLTFQSDQRLLPYTVSAWTQQLDFAEPPNRLNLVFVKQAACP
jgi:2-polyprenyl-3-methyl-5-hydroxy-6-metoxy-1,4-benzoquinol methylase